jgi:hypothetical protein
VFDSFFELENLKGRFLVKIFLDFLIFDDYLKADRSEIFEAFSFRMDSDKKEI